MEMLMKLFQSIGAIIVGGWLGINIGAIILTYKIKKENKERK